MNKEIEVSKVGQEITGQQALDFKDTRTLKDLIFDFDFHSKPGNGVTEWNSQGYGTYDVFENVEASKRALIQTYLVTDEIGWPIAAGKNSYSQAILPILEKYVDFKSKSKRQKEDVAFDEYAVKCINSINSIGAANPIDSEIFLTRNRLIMPNRALDLLGVGMAAGFIGAAEFLRWHEIPANLTTLLYLPSLTFPFGARLLKNVINSENMNTRLESLELAANYADVAIKNGFSDEESYIK